MQQLLLVDLIIILQYNVSYHVQKNMMVHHGQQVEL